MKLRFVVFLSIFSFVLSFSVLGQTTATTVAAWNISGFSQVPDARIPNLVRAIQNINPDVIVLSEVNPDAVAGKIAEQAGYKFRLLDQTANLNLALLYKPEVCLIGAELIPGSNDNNTGLRKALAATVQIGNFDFLIIGVHMKASRGSSDRNTRTRQAVAIRNFIENPTRFAEKDVLLLGDYNMIPGQDDVNFLNMTPLTVTGDRYLRYISTEALAGQTSHISSCAGGRQPFGRVRHYPNRDTRIYRKQPETLYVCRYRRFFKV